MNTPFDPMDIAGYGLSPAAPFNPTGLTSSASPSGLVPFSGGGGLFSGSGLGFNQPTFQLALGGLQTLGNIWGGLKSLSLAKKQLAFSKGFANANLANQTQSYNTQIADRARARGFTEGQSPSQVDDYITKNSLPQRTVR